MVLTAAEKQKRYRERMRANNPEKFEEAKRKNAVRNKERKKICECSEREKEILRAQWRNRKNRQKDKIKENVTENNSDLTESNDLTHNRARLAERRKFQKHLALVKNSYEVKINKMAKNIAALKKKCYRLTKKQELLIARINELEVKNAEFLINNVPLSTNTIQDDIEMTPLTKTESFIEENIPNISTPEKQKVKRQLLNYNVLTNAIQNTYKNSKDNKDRNVLKKVVEDEIVNKYKVKSITTAVLGLKGRVRHRRSILRNNTMILEEIKQFYERDDVSRATAGKNEVKTFKKNKRQRRYLLKSLKDLYKKYRLEGGKAKYTAFKKYRPFYVLRPKLSNRETCGCIKHENIMLKIEKLKLFGMIETKDLDIILSKVQCDLNSKECAYRECSFCKDKVISLNWGSHNQSETVNYEEFRLDKHEYTNKKDNKIYITKKMEKKPVSESLGNLVQKFNIELSIIKKHIYNIKHQYNQYTSCIKNLKNIEVALHIDFSENYTCKLATEVQSMHFGASKPQITIHTGVLYTSGTKPQAFASLSPSNEHGPEAIWAHLEPILNHIRKEFPTVSAVHFFSDGPTSQYKQKKNFYMFSKHTKLLGFPNSTWNFSESSHGKGAADGVGGALKRRLDGYVSQGIDIPNAQTAFKILKDSDTSVMIFYVTEADIARYTISEILTPVPQTMILHQIANTEIADVIKFRCLSCFCSDVLFPKGHCECLDVKNHQLIPNKESEKDSDTINNRDRNKAKENDKKRKISELSEISDSEQEEKENRNETEKIGRTGNDTKKKVTLLSEVRYKPENRAFCIKRFHNGKPNLINIDMCDTLNLSYKKNIDIYHNPTPSTSTMSELNEKQNITLKKTRFRETQNIADSSGSSTENYDDFSVHDTSDDEQFIPDSDSIITRETVEEETGNNHNIQEETDINKITDKECDSPNTKDDNISVGDSVLVRYFIRQSWKYYVGFIERVEVDVTVGYSVLFLKTIYKPTLKFVPTKKDRDIVPELSVVKRIELELIGKAYVLKDTSDQIYFL